MIPAEPFIAEWVESRIEDVMAREGERSLEIRSGKPLGSFGFVSMRSLLWAAWKNRRHLRGANFFIGIGPPGYWLYVWHHESLQALLDAHREVLVEAHWPTRAEAFVSQAREQPVAPLTPLFDLVAAAYGDSLSPGRTDVLPGVPRCRLLAALGSFPDPSLVYFTLFPQALSQ